MADKLFGTDGMRGKVNTYPMTSDVVLRVGMAAGILFRDGDPHHRVVVGKDTRLSGYQFEPALTAGLVSVGMNPILVGPLPTPAVAMLTRSLRAAFGVMITASHNPAEDNGIKLFGPDGYKLADAVEEKIEAMTVQDMSSHLSAPDALGRASRLDDAQGRYLEFVKHAFPRQLQLDGLRMVVDCANGAAYRVAPDILTELGADVIAISARPDGLNINADCGATSLRSLRSAVLHHEADIGIAFDGDADRVVMCDEDAAIIDGDQILAVIARHWRRKDKFKGASVAATVMSNQGLERFLAALGIGLERTAVGDRYVIERMRALGLNLGGEQCGHIIPGRFTTTGDGLIAALQVLAAMVESGQSASVACHAFDPVPQVTKSIRFAGPCPLERKLVREAVCDAEHRLGNEGRLLVRKSGTEPVIRIMAESDDQAALDHAVHDIAAAIDEAA